MRHAFDALAHMPADLRDDQGLAPRILIEAEVICAHLAQPARRSVLAAASGGFILSGMAFRDVELIGVPTNSVARLTGWPGLRPCCGAGW
jgi:hypothetical protein